MLFCCFTALFIFLITLAQRIHLLLINSYQSIVALHGCVSFTAQKNENVKPSPLALLAKTQPMQLIQEQTQRHGVGSQTQSTDMFSQRDTSNRTHHNWIIHLINLSWMNVNREKQT